MHTFQINTSTLSNYTIAIIAKYKASALDNILYSFFHLKFESAHFPVAPNRWIFHLGLAGLELALGLSYGLLCLFSASVADGCSHSDDLFFMDDKYRLCAYWIPHN